MRLNKAIAGTGVVVFILAAYLVTLGALKASAANEFAEVKHDFEEICSNSANGDSLSPAELQKLLNRCDQLKPRIEKLDDADRRFYLRRLKSCRDLYQFLLESSQGDQPAAAPARK
ncbi:MAG TPA: hypothetical protein VK654_06650 [Nitrospirota bacterium]|nr:hypothetical protein [Nitrospirota bacterium]